MRNIIHFVRVPGRMLCIWRRLRSQNMFATSLFLLKFTPLVGKCQCMLAKFSKDLIFNRYILLAIFCYSSYIETDTVVLQKNLVYLIVTLCSWSIKSILPPWNKNLARFFLIFYLMIFYLISIYRTNICYVHWGVHKKPLHNRVK